MNQKYEHVKNIQNKFNIKNLEKNTKLYNEPDIFILDIFENVRDECLKTYKLDPSLYFTVPGLSWDYVEMYKNIILSCKSNKPEIY